MRSQFDKVDFVQWSFHLENSDSFHPSWLIQERIRYIGRAQDQSKKCILECSICRSGDLSQRKFHQDNLRCNSLGMRCLDIHIHRLHRLVSCLEDKVDIWWPKNKWKVKYKLSFSFEVHSDIVLLYLFIQTNLNWFMISKNSNNRSGQN